MRVLIVRLSSLGDVVHTIPVAAALRRQCPDATIDWVVDERNADLLTMVPVIDRRIVLRSRSRSTWNAWATLRRELRGVAYDVALDVQGLGKSALVARLSGARRVVGFTTPFLREPWARWLYTERSDPGQPRHVVDRNLGILRAVGVDAGEWTFPLEPRPSSAPDEARRLAGSTADRFVLLNPNTAWPNKCWPPDRFGAVAAHLRRAHDLPSVVLWGPGDESRAEAVVAASEGAATLAPRTNLFDLVALLGAGSLMVSGDTGPLHIAAALGTPVVGIYGPSDPARNGPWSPDDVVVSNFAECRCHQERDRTGQVGRMVRVCQEDTWCLDHATVGQVASAVDQRLWNA